MVDGPHTQWNMISSCGGRRATPFLFRAFLLRSHSDNATALPAAPAAPRTGFEAVAEHAANAHIGGRQSLLLDSSTVIFADERKYETFKYKVRVSLRSRGICAAI